MINKFQGILGCAIIFHSDLELAEGYSSCNRKYLQVQALFALWMLAMHPFCLNARNQI
jgi:hypothetical protein